MKTRWQSIAYSFVCSTIIMSFIACGNKPDNTETENSIAKPIFKLIPSEKFVFNSFVDCNMATVWVKDTFRIFPGKYGEDPLSGAFR